MNTLLYLLFRHAHGTHLLDAFVLLVVSRGVVHGEGLGFAGSTEVGAGVAHICNMQLPAPQDGRHCRAPGRRIPVILDATQAASHQ